MVLYLILKGNSHMLPFTREQYRKEAMNKCTLYKSFIFVKKKCIESAFKTSFSVHNHYLNLGEQVEMSQWILCNRKTGFDLKI